MGGIMLYYDFLISFYDHCGKIFIEYLEKKRSDPPEQHRAKSEYPPPPDNV